MKTLKKQIETMLLLIVLVVSTNCIGQNQTEHNRLFVRVYNLNGKKLNKGKVLTVTDTLLLLKKGKGTIEIASSDIGFIKTKHSAGHNVLMGAAIGAATASVIEVASINPNDSEFIFDSTPDNVGEALAGGVIGGGIAGSAIGAITILFKNSETFIINGDESKWKVFEHMINK